MSDPTRSLEATRLRLQQLAHTLSTTLHTLHSTPTIPPSTFLVLSSALHSLSLIMNQHFPAAAATSTLVTYPLPTFPAAQQEILLTTLLTKRLRPEVVDTIQRAVEESREDSEERTRAREEVWEEVAEIGEALSREAEAIEAARRGEAEAERGTGEAERERLVGLLRFVGTGVPVEEQTALPRGVGGAGKR